MQDVDTEQKGWAPSRHIWKEDTSMNFRRNKHKWDVAEKIQWRAVWIIQRPWYHNLHKGPNTQVGRRCAESWGLPSETNHVRLKCLGLNNGVDRSWDGCQWGRGRRWGQELEDNVPGQKDLARRIWPGTLSWKIWNFTFRNLNGNCARRFF